MLNVCLFRLFTFVVLFFVCVKQAYAFEIKFDYSPNEQKEVFYNEKTDCINGKCVVDKNFAKIGAETYAQKNLWRKFYAGIAIIWTGKRFGYASDKFVVNTNFWNRFTNLDVYFGARLNKYIGIEIGYTHYDNLHSNAYKNYLDQVQKYNNAVDEYNQNIDAFFEEHKDNTVEQIQEDFQNNTNIKDARNKCEYEEKKIEEEKNKYNKYRKYNGIYASLKFFSPKLAFDKYTSIEGYLSVGGTMMFTKLNDNRPLFGAKFGAGLIVQIYGPFAINVGVDYIYPLKQMSDKGVLLFKTGFNLYLNI